MKKRCVSMILALALLLSVAVLPVEKAEAKSKPWYVKYCEYKKTAKKSLTIKGNKLTLKGKWANSTSRYTTAKEKKIKKTFKLTSDTTYYIEDTESEKMKKVSQHKFKKNMYSDLSTLQFKIKSGKVTSAIVSVN